jgi:hypothetical protein
MQCGMMTRVIEKTTNQARAKTHPRERLFDDLLGYIKRVIDPKIITVKSAKEIPNTKDALGTALHEVTYPAEE